MRPFCTAILLLLPLSQSAAQGRTTFSRADTLRGSFTTPARAWWDVSFYDLHVAINPADSSIRGYNGISYRVLVPARELQVDLMIPLVVDSMVQECMANGADFGAERGVQGGPGLLRESEERQPEVTL